MMVFEHRSRGTPREPMNKSNGRNKQQGGSGMVRDIVQRTALMLTLIFTTGIVGPRVWAG